MTPLQLKQMKASGGINKLAAEHIEYLQKTIDVANTIMKEKQETIDMLKGSYSKTNCDAVSEAFDRFKNAQVTAHEKFGPDAGLSFLQVFEVADMFKKKWLEVNNNET